MAVLHLSLTEIGRMDWTELVFYHEAAARFYEADVCRRVGLPAFEASPTPPEYDFTYEEADDDGG